MAKRKSRTITMTDEVYDGLKAIAQFRQLQGEKISASEILEELAAEYVEKNSEKISVIQAGKNAMQVKIQSLVDGGNNNEENPVKNY